MLLKKVCRGHSFFHILHILPHAALQKLQLLVGIDGAVAPQPAVMMINRAMMIINTCKQHDNSIKEGGEVM